MEMCDSLNIHDEESLSQLGDFVPSRVFDIHAHLFHRSHFIQDNLSVTLRGKGVLGMEEYRSAIQRWLPGRAIEGLFFGFPNRGNDRQKINAWMAAEAKRFSANSRALALVSPADDPEDVARQISEFNLVGIKPYHLYAGPGNTSQAEITDFAPEWMWELCHKTRGVLMLHIMRDQAIADPENQAAIQHLCRKYPECRLVLPHIARSFCYRHARRGLASLVRLSNVWIDTSAITETETMRRAIETFGPQRILFGSDYPISELRGRCVAVGDQFHWIYDNCTEPPLRATLVAIESLMCLKEASEDSGLSNEDVENIFHYNAGRLLEPHLGKTANEQACREVGKTPEVVANA